MKACFTFLAVLLAGHLAAAGPEDTEPLRLRLSLTDGSVLIGTPAVSNLSVRTSYADMQIKLKVISSMAFSDDREMATLQFRNGDKLTGAIRERKMPLQTLIGDISIGLEHIKSLHVMAGPLPAGLLRGLVLHLSFNDPDRIRDLSGNGHDATAHGAKYTKDAKVGGGAFQFGGQRDHVQMGSPVRADPPLSVAFWLKPGKLGHVNQYLICNGGFTAPAEGFFVLLLPNQDHGAAVQRQGMGLQFGVQSRKNNFGGNIKSWPLSLGTWHHIVCTWDGSATVNSLKIYLNGSRFQASGTQGSVNMDSRPQNLRIGMPSSTAARYPFTGAIDEVMIYNRALSSTEARQLYEFQAEQ